MPELVEEATFRREELFKRSEDKDRLVKENKILIATGTEISDLKTYTFSIVGSIHETKSKTI